jgi:sialidase-1
LNVFSPNLLRLRNGDILFVYMRYIALADGIVPSVSCFMCRSRDDGRTFSEPSPIWTKKPWGYASGVLKQLSTGRILLPMDWQMGLVWSKMDHAAAGCVYSDDNGRTWNEPVSWVDLPLRGAMEAHVEELKDGRILMVLRTQLGSVFKCVSSDGGLTWTKPQTTGLKSPESCPELVRAPGAGDLVLFWNNGIYNPVADHFGRRTPLTVALSRDEGETWRIVRDIETNPERAFTNPGCLITSRNKVLLTYWTTPYDAHGRMTCKRIDLKLARFDLDWLYSA